MVFLQHRAQDAGQVADVLGDQEVVLHEPLHPAHAGTVGVAHAPRDFRLDVEGQPVLVASGDVMQVGAHGEQEVLRLEETVEHCAGDDLLRHQFVDVVDVVDIAADPPQGVQIAQAALAFLQVGLQHVA